MSQQQTRESGNGGGLVIMQQTTNNNEDELLNLKDIELSLSLPGTKTTTTGRTKRGFSHTALLDLHLGTLSSSSNSTSDSVNNHTQVFFSSSSTSKPPPSKAQVVGWPPVRANRKNAMMMKSGKYVKVAVDGTPYLRKVDLEMYDSYEHLLTALESMFSCLTIRNDMKERKLMEGGNGGSEYMPTYEDKDGDWMLVGDVPWKMFVESCKRIRLMIKSEATFGLGPSLASKCTGSS